MTSPEASPRQAARAAYQSADWLAVEQVCRAAQPDPETFLQSLDREEATALNDPAWPFLRGCLLDRLGRWEEAAGAYADSARLNPEAAEPFYRMGLALARGGLHEPAVQAFDRALGRDRAHLGARLGAGVSLRCLGRVGEALRLLDELPPPHPPGWINNHAEFLLEQGRVEDALRELRAAESLLRRHAGLHSSLIRAMIYDPRVTARDLFEETGRWNAWHAAPRPAPPPLREPDPERPLRVGYVSACLYRHNSSAHLMNLLRARDRARFHVTLYHAGTVHDDWTAALRGLADEWREIVALPDEQAAALIREDQVDLLVDLNEHANNGRLTLFTHKPAPLQFHWYGNAVTTGVKAIDYRFSDAVAEPPGEADRWSHEAILRPATGYHCYGPPPEVAGQAPEPPFRRNGFVTFGAVHHLAKLNDEVLACWEQILEQTPGSQLLLARDVLVDPDTRRILTERLRAAGVDPGRVRLCGDARAIATLAVYQKMDVVLDSFPFNGDATTGDALWMGVPVITLRGDRLSARRAAGLLHTVGADQWIASNREEYMALAATWARDPGRLAGARAALPEQVRQSPLCDAAAVAREIEAAYRQAWRRACATVPS
jgi:protein O-GlcNAc transferase